MSLTCVIVEDLQVAADFLVRCCQKSGQVEVKGHFTNAEEALKYLKCQYCRPDFPRRGNAGLDRL